MKPIEPREAMWTQANKASLRPGDIVRFTYAAYPNDTPIVGKVAEVDHSDYIIYFEQAPEELQKFSRTAAAPITYDPEGRIDLYLAPNDPVKHFRDLYASGARYLAKDTPAGFCWAYRDKPYRVDEDGSWIGSCPTIVDPWSPIPQLVDPELDEPLCIADHCRFACLTPEARTRTRTRWTFSRDKWAEDLNNLPDALGFDPSKRKWPSTLDGCVVWFDSDEDDVGTAYDEYGTEYEVHRDWCDDEIIEEDNTNVGS